MKRRTDSGIALITAVLMLALMSALLVGVTTLAVNEQRSRFQDKDRTRAFEAAHGGLEKLTNDLGDLFNRTYAPTDGQIAGLRAAVPEIDGAVYSLQGNDDPTSGYTIERGVEEKDRRINDGTWEGLFANITPYTVSVTARTPTEAEVTLQRTVNTVAIPVFQFGIFSETDLSYFPGPRFNFGGRVHTNGNLFLAKRDGSELILGDRVTAFKDIVRQYLANDHPSSSSYSGTVRVLTEPGGCAGDNVTDDDKCRPLGLEEGSVVGKAGSPPNQNRAPLPNWDEISEQIYGRQILDGDTGAHELQLPLTSGTATPIDLIKRPAANEKTTAPDIYSQRYYQYASLRIILSNDEAQITDLPDSATPTKLSNLTGASNVAKDGYILIMKQGAPDAGATNGDWTNVTTDILNKGFRGRNPSCAESTAPKPDAIIRIQRIGNDQSCNDTSSTDDWPNTLYDPREGLIRDVVTQDSSKPRRGGVMYFVELDLKNLRAWLKAQDDIMQETGGYVVYFSDRRGNKDFAHGNRETGELGFEDVVNPTVADGTSAGVGVLEEGEDLNGDHLFNRYGGGSTASTVTYWDPLGATAAQQAAPTLFRRALKLVHGGRKAMVGESEDHLQGLTIASENPVYIHGDYNATISEDVAGDDWNETYDKPHIASAVIADAVTLLSNEWRDNNSFTNAHNLGGRVPNSKGAVYRTAIIAGKSLTFHKPSWATTADLGTDGGTHNFLRFLERWNNGNGIDYPVWYRGSMVSFYTSRQAVGIFKCCNIVYGAPGRKFTFDEDFKNTSKLPPRTPVVRDTNTTTFQKKAGPPSS